MASRWLLKAVLTLSSPSDLIFTRSNGNGRIFNLRAIIASLRRCVADRRGSTALTFALAGPVLLGAVALSVDYSNLSLRKSRLQELADSAALSGARELRLANPSNGPVIAAAQHYVDANASSVTDSAISFS